MDGLGLELWNKKLIFLRHQRRLELDTKLELSHIKGLFNTSYLPILLYQVAVENLSSMVHQWQDAYQGSWDRQRPVDPQNTASVGERELASMLTAEYDKIEEEIAAIGTVKKLSWTPEDLREGQSLLKEQVSVLRAQCQAHLASLRSAREEELGLLLEKSESHRIEVRETRVLITILILVSGLMGVWVGAALHAKHSTADRLHIDQKMEQLSGAQRQVQDELYEVRKSNKKIAYWTEKTTPQIDQEISDTRAALAKEIQDIRDEISRKLARVESAYSRSGRDGGTELEDRKQNLLSLQAKLIREAESRAQQRLNDLEEQKRNIMR